MTRKGNYASRIQLLATEIRKEGELGFHQACIHLGVGPWQMRHYVQTILATCPDIRYEDQTFRTILGNADKQQRTLREIQR